MGLRWKRREIMEDKERCDFFHKYFFLNTVKDSARKG